MLKVFVAYNNPVTFKWSLVGCLEHDGVNYKFYYVQGLDLDLSSKINGFPDSELEYVSPFLFPFFSNRLMRKSRPDYATYLSYLGLDPEYATPMDIFTVDGGRKATDHYEIFSLPHINCDGEFHADFFVDLINEIDDLTTESKIYLTSYDLDGLTPVAVVRKRQGDDLDVIIAKCPEWISEYIPPDDSRFKLEVLKINEAPAPFSKRLQCRLSFDEYAFGIELMKKLEFEPYCAN